MGLMTVLASVDRMKYISQMLQSISACAKAALLVTERLSFFLESDVTFIESLRQYAGVVSQHRCLTHTDAVVFQVIRVGRSPCGSNCDVAPALPVDTSLPNLHCRIDDLYSIRWFCI